MNGMQRVLVACLVCCLSLAIGCGPRATQPGTAGKLLISGEPVGEILVHIHKLEAGQPARLGFGETKADGSFHLFTNEGRGPLVLVPGDYAITLESSGTPFAIPPEFQKPESTPLKTSWGASNSTLDLSASFPLALPALPPQPPANTEYLNGEE